MNDGPLDIVPIGFVQVVSGLTGVEADRFDRHARLITPFRYALPGVEAGSRGSFDTYVDVWVHPDDVELAKGILNRARS